MSTENPALGRRERKQRATRDRLLTAAQAHFAERGYDRATMDDIAADADVSRATAFNYFPRKEELLLALAERRREVIADLLARERSESADVADRLHRVFANLCDIFDTDVAGTRSLTRAWVQAGGPLLPDAFATAAIFADTLDDARARGQVRPDIDPGSAGRILLDAYLGALVHWAAGQDTSTATLRNHLSTVVDTIINGLRPPRTTGARAAHAPD
ncbi:TetR/AcrR family transcriptional regulator [Virgisporangium aurantiacum]|uniref:TetR family transcriptional regulator n=1 Tax=Virgisporangium aurantiacum TaxID=175570 RepID=A0A8J4E092_9ACTN|nr:TetR/AcrR family transcriptional regulator [Virgisporangium aurantiacum]GIJ56739.1 TetR family transcriptional regulator [Virgisporangium aurantiacum]